MLHTINKSPFTSKTLEQCLKFIAKNEPVLLFEDAVYAAQGGTKYETEIQDLIKSNPVYALQSDIKARAVNKIIPGIKVIDYDGFVDLVAQNKVQNWL